MKHVGAERNTGAVRFDEHLHKTRPLAFAPVTRSHQLAASGSQRSEAWPDGVDAMDRMDTPGLPQRRGEFEIPGPDAKSLATVFIGSTRRDDSGSRTKPWAE